jgi:ankyrin repeat protein
MEKGCDAILPTLFKAGALPDYENKNGVTPLILATRLASKTLIAALGDAGASLNHESRKGFSALLVGKVACRFDGCPLPSPVSRTNDV